MEPIAPQTLVDRTRQLLLDAIVSGGITTGGRISEVQLARQLGISRGPLREALSKLEGQGLVVRLPHLGVRVVDMTLADVDELFALREALEGMAARSAAHRIRASEIDALRRLLDSQASEIDLAERTGYTKRSRDEDFHFRIARASGNRRLIGSLCDDLYHFIRIYRVRSTMKPGRAAASLAEHVEIVDALAAHDPDRAERAMRRHIVQARENLVWMGETDSVAGRAKLRPSAE